MYKRVIGLLFNTYWYVKYIVYASSLQYLIILIISCYSYSFIRKGEGIVHTTTDVLLHFIQDTTTTEIDPTLMEREEIVKLSETSRIMRLRYLFPALMSNREFVIHAYPSIYTLNKILRIFDTSEFMML